MASTRYLNPIGGEDLYSVTDFADAGIELRFLRTRPIEYRQLGAPFVPALSIVDVMMFNSSDAVRRMLGEFDTVS